MKQLFSCLMILCMVRSGYAHPGIGIVCDSRGNIYYTDLANIWKITPSGIKTIVVRSVHSHELSIDRDDNLYGEHLWFTGGTANSWGHYFWCLKKNGQLVKTTEAANGYTDNNGLLRDNANNVYWVERFTISRFKKKTLKGVISTVGEGKFNDIRWTYCNKAGFIFFADEDKLYRLAPDGEFNLLASNLDEKGIARTGIERREVYGIWTDQQENIYTAVFNLKAIKRITPGGKVEIVYQSSNTWTPVSGLFDKNGDMWIMENSNSNEVRVQKINVNPVAQDISTRSFGGYLFPGLLVLISLFVLVNPGRTIISAKQKMAA